ncbi:MAG: hypothetical protein ACPIOQ_30910, partial [Promethearchaeia archaeon]
PPMGRSPESYLDAAERHGVRRSRAYGIFGVGRRRPLGPRSPRSTSAASRLPFSAPLVASVSPCPCC